MTDDRVEDNPSVVIIEDDVDVRESLRGLFHSMGLDVEPFASVREFVDAKRRDRPGCLVLDVRLPGKSGLDFQQEIAKTPGQLPIIFISGHADIEMSVRAMKAGAVEFLTKPVRDQDLLDAVQAALEIDRQGRIKTHEINQWRSDYDQLTPREREVLSLVVTGLRNKQIAAAIGISEATVKLHRASVMQKMKAQSLIDLLRMNDALAATPHFGNN